MADCAFSADAPRASCGILADFSSNVSSRRNLLKAAVAIPIAATTAAMPRTHCAAIAAVEQVQAHENAYPVGLGNSDCSDAAEQAWLGRWRELIAAVVAAQAAGPAGLAAKLQLALSEDRVDIAASVAAQLEAMA